MKLTKRLLKIASLVTKGKKVADIGTDHGYIPVYLLNKGDIPYAILADVNKGPLENAKKEVRHNNLFEKVDLRLGSGIEVLEKNEVDEIIIAGMGGILISDLLGAKDEVAQSVDKLILQPMQAQDELRKYLLNNGYEIINEVLVKEDFRIYEIIEAKYTGKNTKVEDEIFYEISNAILDNEKDLVREFMDIKLKKYTSILDKLDGKAGSEVEKKREISLERLEKIKNMLK